MQKRKRSGRSGASGSKKKAAPKAKAKTARRAAPKGKAKARKTAAKGRAARPAMKKKKTAKKNSAQRKPAQKKTAQRKRPAARDGRGPATITAPPPHESDEVEDGMDIGMQTDDDGAGPTDAELADETITED